MTDYKLMPKQITEEMADAFWEEYSKDRHDDLLMRCYKALYETAPSKPLPDLEVDTKVIVWDAGKSVRLRRHFSHFDDDGIIHVFSDGSTSFSGYGKTVGWDRWKLAE